MKTLPPLKTSEPASETEDTVHNELPGRPRRRFLTWPSAALMALIVGAIGFYVGIRVEKSHTNSSSSAARGAFAGSGATARFAAAPSGAGGGSASFGTVSSVSGNTLYVTDASGSTIKVQLSSATKISKSVSSSKHSLHPGDAVVVSGLTNKKGTVVATAVRDSGSGSGASGFGGAGVGGAGFGGAGGSGGSGSSASSGTSGSAAVKSLFGPDG